MWIILEEVEPRGVMEGFESYQRNFRIDMEVNGEPAALLLDGADGG